MNIIERTVYDLVKGNPKLKIGMRKLYQSVFDLVPYKACISPYEITTREGYFFGFHDKVPFSADDSRLLGMRYDIPLRMPTHKDALTIGYFDGENHKNFNEVTKTHSWNWHQGCQLQWRGLSNTEIIFNDFVDEKNVSRVVNVETGQTVNVFDQCISSASDDGKWAVGYSFERVNKCMPGYGYSAGHENDIVAQGIVNAAPDDDGLYAVNLETNSIDRIVSIEQVIKSYPDEEMENGIHFFSHAIISPNSRRVMFLHRWFKGTDCMKRWSRMFTCNRDGSDLYLFPTSGMVSHMGWQDGDHILAYCRDIHGKDGYLLFEDQQKNACTRIGDESYTSDGHPSFDKSGNWILTDTYPDRSRRSYVTLYDHKNRRRYNIAFLKHWKQFASIYPYSHWCCDLHPRWNRAGTTLCFDSVYVGKRSLCTVQVPELAAGQTPKSI